MRLWIGLLLSSWFVSTLARAETPLRVDASAERMRVDGSLREWQGARFTTLGAPPGPEVRFALATADGGLYLGADVHDTQVVRTKGVGGRQDALVLTLAMPDAQGGFRSTEIWLHPGVAGKSKAEAGLRTGSGAPRSEPRIKVVEGPREGGAEGFVLEAFVPWSLVQGAEIWEQGRGALRFENVDDKGAPTRLATSQRSQPKELPRLVLGVGHNDFLGSFLSSQGLAGVEPRYDLRGNVHGDGAPERVVIVDRFVVVYGPGYKQGESYAYAALPLGTGGGIKQAELMDLTADGRAELVLTLRQRNELGAREVWMVYALDGESPQPVFGVELRKEASGGFIENTFQLERKGKDAPRIVVSVGRAQQLDASNYRESSARDVQPVLLPWGAVKARTYGYQDGAFRVLSEQAQAGAAQPSAPQAAASAREPEQVVVRPSVEAVLDLFKRDAKLPKGLKARRVRTGNFFGGPQKEQLFELGTYLVMVGPELGDGGSYLAYGLPVKDPADTLYLGHADVTGDGLNEIFVRIKQPLTGAEGVHREVVLVLRADASGRLARALAAEVTRRQGDKVIENRVLTRGGRLVIDPGRAVGWSESDYPFTRDEIGGADGLLLPWADAARSYRLAGERLVPTP
jgi:hypothetical protein